MRTPWERSKTKGMESSATLPRPMTPLDKPAPEVVSSQRQEQSSEGAALSEPETGAIIGGGGAEQDDGFVSGLAVGGAFAGSLVRVRYSWFKTQRADDVVRRFLSAQGSGEFPIAGEVVEQLFGVSVGGESGGGRGRRCGGIEAEGIVRGPTAGGGQQDADDGD